MLGLLFLVVAFFWANCPCCGGCSCTPGTSFQVDISGVANNTCSNCANFDGTYFLTASATSCTGVATDCLWKYSNGTMTDVCSPSRSCHGVCVALVEVAGASPTCTVSVEGQGFTFGIGCTGFGGANQSKGVFQEAFGAGSTPDCTDYTSLNVPFQTTINTGCQFSGATCTVTPVP